METKFPSSKNELSLDKRKIVCEGTHICSGIGHLGISCF